MIKIISTKLIVTIFVIFFSNVIKFSVLANENKILFPIEDYYNLYLQNQLKKKIPIHSKSFFTKLFNMKSNYIFSCLKNGDLAGYAVVNLNRNNVHLLLSNISPLHLSNGVNQLIYWEIINFSFNSMIVSFLLLVNVISKYFFYLVWKVCKKFQVPLNVFGSRVSCNKNEINL